LISENRDLLDRIAKELLAKESIERDEITAIVQEVNAARNGVKPTPEAVDPGIVGLPSIGSPDEHGTEHDQQRVNGGSSRNGWVAPPRKLRSVAPPGGRAPQSTPPPANGAGPAQQQTAAEPA
jgi:hypothetical protein